MKSEVIKSRENPVVKHFAKLQKERAYREENAEYVLEGAKLLEEAISANAQICTVCYLESRKHDFEFELLQGRDNVRLYSVDEPVIDRISIVKSPQGIVFSCRMPDAVLPASFAHKKIIILDGLSDPGNMGTIIRTADAFAIDAIILTGACTDPFSPKTVRSAMGSLFRVKLYRAEQAEIKKVFEASSVPIFSAMLSNDAKSITELPIDDAAVVIGNEAHGVSEEMQNISAGLIKIPMNGKAESLNAAVSAAIIMWEMTKRR